MRAEVGTGADEFVSIAEGGAVSIVCGPQGGQHIWTAIRTQGIDAQAVHVSLKIRLGDEIVCGQQLDGVTLLDRNGWAETAGVICYVPNPDTVHGQRLRLEGEVTDRFGHTAAAHVSFVASKPDHGCNVL